jgi:hypothetical protein
MMPRYASPDGSRITAVDEYGNTVICMVSTQACAPILGLENEDIVAGWAADSKSLFMYRSKPGDVQIERLDIASGRRTPWKTVRPLKASSAGISALTVSPAGAVVIAYQREASQLYVIKGLK